MFWLIIVDKIRGFAFPMCKREAFFHLFYEKSLSKRKFCKVAFAFFTDLGYFCAVSPVQERQPRQSNTI